MKLEQIADAIDGELVGSGETEICGVCLPDTAGAKDIVFVEKHHYLERAHDSKAGAFLLDRKLKPDDSRPIIFSENPRLSFVKLLQLFDKCTPHSGSSAQGNQCEIDPSAKIMPGCSIGDDVVIGPKVVIHPQCVIEDRVRIGEGSIIYARAVIGHDCKIGHDCVIHPGAVIGSIGFGYHDEGGKRFRIPHLGNVVLSDRVDVGANSTIDRSILGSTFIGADTKIDNLVQVGHNVKIGTKCYVVAQVGIGGSSEIGNGVVLGGQSGVSDHVKVGDQAMIAGKSAIRESLKPGEIVGEPPAFPIRTVNELVHLLPQLTTLFSRVTELETLNQIEEKPTLSGSWRDRVLPLLARSLHIRPELIGDEMDLKEEFNADSLTVLTVVTEIESEFGISIPDSEVRSMRTLNAIVDYLETSYSNKTAEE